jgi:putative FmdB family regulatory protein
MPTYEFRCPQGHEFERFYRTISGAEAQAACPVCGELGQRLMSVSGFAFKGSGFYLTDYGKNAHREKGVEPRKQPSESASSSESSSESSGTEPAKVDGAAAAPKGESAKSEAKSDAKSDGASRGDSANGSPAKAGARSDAKPDGAKPAAAPKKSTGE